MIESAPRPTSSEECHAQVLLIADRTGHVQSIQPILQLVGYQVYVVDTDHLVISYIAQLRPDLILLSTHLDQLDAFELCEQLKSSQVSCDIPILLLTPQRDDKEIMMGFDAGAVDYITQPFNSVELLVRVRTHLELKRAREALQRAYQELKQAYQELNDAARTDVLTKLHNRFAMIEKIEYEIIRAQRNQQFFSLILADIDYFKSINDKYGHQFGDHVLLEVAQLLRTAVRQQDTVARWGGEEFIILLPETDLAGGITVAEKIRQRLNAFEGHHLNQTYRVSMTFGVSQFEPGMAIDTCIQQADEALYCGKHQGRNCVVSAPIADLSAQ